MFSGLRKNEIGSAGFRHRSRIYSRTAWFRPGCLWVLFPLLLPLVFADFHSPASAFITLNNDDLTPIGWVDEGIPVYLDVTGVDGVVLEDVEEALVAALTSWSTVSCADVWVEYAGLVVESPGAGIYVHWTYPEALNGLLAQDAAGVTETYHGSDGVVYRADVHLNRSFLWTLDGLAFDPRIVDVEGVLTHELGHALGLAHTRYREATMYFSGGDSRLRSLEDDDMRGLCFLYGEGGVSNLCDSCVSDVDCVEPGSSCLVFPLGGSYCASPCGAEEGCPQGYQCTLIPGLGDERCLPDNGTCREEGAAIDLGEYCYGSTTCQSGFCLATLHSASCTRVCELDVPDGCPETMVCAGGVLSECPENFQPDHCGVCMIYGDLPIGSLCWDGSECQSGICMAGEKGAGVCTISCVNFGVSCPDDSICTLGVCILPGERPTGAPCDNHFECEGAHCLPGLDGVFRCSETCQSNGDCPSNASCGTFEDSRPCNLNEHCDSGVCLVSLGVCGCMSDATCDFGLTCNPSFVNPDLQVCGRSLCASLAKKGQDGEFCNDEQGCFGNLLCELKGSDWGRCGQPCDPVADTDCGEGLCAWLTQAADQTQPVGVCGPPENGGVEGAVCSESLPCERHLVCVQVDGGQPTCYHDCLVLTSEGCQEGAVCVALGDGAFPDRGACLEADSMGAVTWVQPGFETSDMRFPDDFVTAPPGGTGPETGDAFIPVDSYVPPKQVENGCHQLPNQEIGWWWFFLVLVVGSARCQKRVFGG